jgi:hypothetical protein
MGGEFFGQIEQSSPPYLPGLKAYNILYQHGY